MITFTVTLEDLDDSLSIEIDGKGNSSENLRESLIADALSHTLRKFAEKTEKDLPQLYESLDSIPNIYDMPIDSAKTLYLLTILQKKKEMEKAKGEAPDPSLN